jgi:O-antigen/teichoic acid export membrane protein
MPRHIKSPRKNQAHRVIPYLRALAYRAKTHDGFRRYAANTTWMFAEQMLRMVAALLVGIWVARYLGPSQFGLFSYALAFASLFGSIAKLGLDSIVVRDLVTHPEQRDVYLGTAFWLKLIGAVVMLGVIGMTMQFTNSDATTNLYIFIIASGSVFQSFEVVDFYFQSKVLSRFVSICKLTQLVISSLIKLYLIYIHAELFWFVLVSLMDQATLAVTLYLAYRYQGIGGFFGRFNGIIAKKLLCDSWPLILSGLVIMIYMRIDQIMIKEMLGEKEVGIYTAAVRLSEVWYFVPMLLIRSVAPSLINAKKIGNALYYSRLRKLYSLMIWSAISIAVPIMFLGKWIVVCLYGYDFRDAGNILVLHIWASIFVFLGVASGNWYMNENLQKYSTINTVVGAIVNILLNLILIPLYDIYGAAIATVISYSIAAYFMNLAYSATRKNFYHLSTALFHFRQ